MTPAAPAVPAASAASTVRTGRRGLLIAVLLTMAGGALELLAAGRPWAYAVVRQPPPLPVHEVAVSGADLGGAVRAYGLLALAGAPALIATTRGTRVLVGLVLVAAGVASLLVLGSLGAGHVRDTTTVQALVATATTVTVSGRTGWPVGYALGALLVVAAGGLTVLRGARWPGMSSRYDAPSRRPGTRGGTRVPAGSGGRSELDPWTALDRGEDPTLR